MWSEVVESIKKKLKLDKAGADLIMKQINILVQEGEN